MLNYKQPKISGEELPSNRKFGFFFTAVFGMAGTYFLNENTTNVSLFLFGLATLFLIVTILKSGLLLPLNKLWMRLGLFLGMIVSPIVLGVIFFGLFTPIAFLMRLVGRDELRLRFKPCKSYWKVREPRDPSTETFRNQY